MLHSHIKSQIAEKCSDKWRGQYQSDTMTERVWQKLDPEVTVQLIDDARNIPRYDLGRDVSASELLREMQACGEWRISAAPHEGGHGDSGRHADKNLHITIRVDGTSYHLRCKEEPTLHIIQITK